MRKLWFLWASIFLLSGCGPVYETHYNYVPPASWHGRQCANHCLAKRSRCRTSCQSAKQVCRSAADMDAMPAYLDYAQDQRNSGEPVVNSVSDFADYSNCPDKCGCGSTYRACFSNCGGTVIANTQCVAFCNEKIQSS